MKEEFWAIIVQVVLTAKILFSLVQQYKPRILLMKTKVLCGVYWNKYDLEWTFQKLLCLHSFWSRARSSKNLQISITTHILLPSKFSNIFPSKITRSDMWCHIKRDKVVSGACFFLSPYFYEKFWTLQFLTSFFYSGFHSRATAEDDPLQRMKMIVKFYLSGFYKKPKGLKKPYNPILGETFRCKWEHPDNSTSYYVAEQVSFLVLSPLSDCFFPGNFLSCEPESLYITFYFNLILVIHKWEFKD